MVAFTTAIPDFTGRSLNNGRYNLLCMLGSGAYGVVYLALDLKAPSSSTSSTSSQRAIKIIRKANLSKHQEINVRRECSLHLLIGEHPNVVTMHTAFEDEEYVYLVLDYCPGGDLFSKICDEGVYFRNDELLRKAFVQILDAVQACHRKRIFHRDLKPENILCNEDGSVAYLADFGLATIDQLSNVFGCGSSGYMSPECIGEETDFTPYYTKYADIWALGVILVNMITARSPWSVATTKDDCFHDYLLDEDFLREMLPISKGANDILNKIFVIEPEERISVPQLRDAILSLDTFFMSDEEIAVAPESVKYAAEAFIKNPPKHLIQKRAEKSIRQAAPIPRTPIIPFDGRNRESTPATSPVGSVCSSSTLISLDSRMNISSDSLSTCDTSEGLLTPESVAADLDPGFGLGGIPNTDDFLLEDLIKPQNRPLRVVNQTEVVVQA